MSEKTLNEGGLILRFNLRRRNSCVHVPARFRIERERVLPQRQHHTMGTGGMRMNARYCAARQLTGILLVLVGVLLVFLCLPMQFLLIAFGVVLVAAGFLLLR